MLAPCVGAANHFTDALGLYVIDGVLANPDWTLVLHHSIVPHMPRDSAGWIAVAAKLGTTLAPWGLAFIQSYAVDKKVTLANLRWERIDVVIGSTLTGVIGLATAVGIYTAYPGADGLASAEVAFTTEEDYRGQGIAQLLLDALAGIARAHGIARLDAEVMAENRAMLRVFDRSGLPMHRSREDNVVHVELDLRPALGGVSSDVPAAH